MWGQLSHVQNAPFDCHEAFHLQAAECRPGAHAQSLGSGRVRVRLGAQGPGWLAPLRDLF